MAAVLTTSRAGRGDRARVPGLLLIALALCAGCAERERAPRNTVNGVITRDPPSMSLVGKADSLSERIAAQITEGLVGFDASMRLQPRVAESWSLSDDGRTLRFTLRDGVRWHDGRPVTSADVAFTVEQVRDPLVESRAWRSDFSGLVSIDTPDERTVVARYAEATPDLLDAWRVPLIPAHLAEPGAALLTGEFQRHPVGCGPFRFVRYRRGEEIVLEANDDYWDGRPTIDRLVFRIYPDQQTGYRALLAGDVDVMTVTSNLWREARESEHADRLASFAYRRLAVWMLIFNQDGGNPYFGDVRVRRAMMHALDRESFLRTMMHGLGRVAVTTYHPDLEWTDSSLEPPAYDVTLAGRLLDEAGWRDTDRDGVRDRDGEPFEFALAVNASPLRIVDEMAAWMQQSWAELGLRVSIDRMESTQFRQRRRAGEYEALMSGISYTPSPDLSALYHSDPERGTVNWMSFSDPEVDRLLDAGVSTFDRDRRREIYFALQRRLLELQPVGCVMHFEDPVLHDRRLVGITPTPLDYWRHSAGPRTWRWSEAGGGG